MPQEWTILTGATGFVGRHILRELLEAGEKVVCIVRKDTDSFRLYYPNSLEPISFAILGDITKPEIVKDDSIQDLECCRMIHCAADVSFDNSYEVLKTNFVGTCNVLRLCNRFGIEEFHYVSTAYVCGNQKGKTVSEFEPDVGYGRFRNAYETSKYAAELVACQWRNKYRRRKLSIYRPTIVVGHSKTGETSCYRSFYRLVRFGASMVGAPQHWADAVKSFRVNLTGHEPVNLVPVDWVAKLIAHCACNPKSQGGVFHVTPNKPFTTGQIARILGKKFGFPDITMVGNEPIDNPNFIEKNLTAWMGEYAAYWGTDPYFETGNTDSLDLFGDLDDAFIERIANYAISTNFGRK